MAQKKVMKTHINSYKKNTNILDKFKPTIYVCIVFVILIIVIIVECIMFGVSREALTAVQQDMVTRIFYEHPAINLKDKLNNDEDEGTNTTIGYERAVRTGYMVPQLNNGINDPRFKVKDVFIFDEIGTLIYSSADDTKFNQHPECKTNKCEYKYKIQDANPKTFRYISNSLYDPKEQRIIRIEVKDKFDSSENKNKSYYVYLVIPPASNKYEKFLVSNFLQLFAVITILTLVIALMFANSISKPLLKMEKIVSHIANGDLSGRLEYTKYYELNKLVYSYNITIDALQKLYSSLENKVFTRTNELRQAYSELKNTQAMMVHSEKMKSLGELVAGIMHEINNPINFIYGNMTHLSNYSNDLMQIIDEYTKFNESLKPEEKEEIEKLKKMVDYEFLKTDLPDLIKSCKEGAERAKNIIQDLKSFSRMESSAITDIDVVHEIDTTLNILHNKIKNKAEVHKVYMENVPKIEAFGGQLNQVFMNILDNAVGAIKDRGDIWIRINNDETKTKLIIEIEDNGVGMDPEVADKIFDPFFTTKPVGQGTGLGLSITHKIIKNHQGNIKVESRAGMGSKFIITLPINIDREQLNDNITGGEANGK